MYYIFICFNICFFSKKKVYSFRKIINIKKFLCWKNIKNFNFHKLNGSKKLVNKTILFIVIICLTYSLINFKKRNFKLYFVDVGQGDCCIIQVEGKNIIIDSGEGNSELYDYGKNVVFQHLLKLGIKKLDYVVFSHMDSDHARRFNVYFTKYES